MALRIPKVPIWDELDQETWTDIHKYIEKQRFILLSKKLNRKEAKRIMDLLFHYDSENETLPIAFYINSKGGKIGSGLMILDVLEAIESEVYTAVLGSAKSSAALILSAGTCEKRYAFPHARVHIYQPISKKKKTRVRAVKTKTKTKKISPQRLFLNQCAELKKREIVADILAKNTGQSITVIRENLNRRHNMSASEALEFGIIDKIVKNEK